MGPVRALAAACGALLCLFASATTPASALEFEPLVRSLAAEGKRQLGFEELRYLPALSAPLRSEGKLIYEPPDRLIKVIESPRVERAIIDGRYLRVEDGAGTEIAFLDLATRPAERLIFAAIFALLEGEPERLVALFTPRLSGTEASWVLELVPHDEAAKEKVARVLVRGLAKRFVVIEVLASNGARSVLRLIHPGDAP